MGTWILATDFCVDVMPLGRGRDQRTWSGNRPVEAYGIALASRPFGPQHQQKPVQRPSAPRYRIP